MTIVELKHRVSVASVFGLVCITAAENLTVYHSTSLDALLFLVVDTLERFVNFDDYDSFTCIY